MTGAIKRKWNNASVRSKMLLAFIVPVILILIVNIYMYVSINTMIERVDEIYVANVTLNDLSEDLTMLQNSMREYLESKGTTALNDYYTAEQDYRNGLASLDLKNSGTAVYAMQENITNQSENYLRIAGDTITSRSTKPRMRIRSNCIRIFRTVYTLSTTSSSRRIRATTVSFCHPSVPWR